MPQIIGNIGGRHTKIKRVTVAVPNSGSGANNMSVYQCPANTEARLSRPQLFISGQAILGSIWQVVDGVTGRIFDFTINRQFLVQNVWFLDSWAAQDFSLETGSNPYTVSIPDDTGRTVPTNSNQSSANAFFFSRIDPRTGELILRDGDLFRLAVSAFSGGSSTVTINIDVKEETRG